MYLNEIIQAGNIHNTNKPAWALTQTKIQSVSKFYKKGQSSIEEQGKLYISKATEIHYRYIYTDLR